MDAAEGSEARDWRLESAGEEFGTRLEDAGAVCGTRSGGRECGG